jgi:hypothetical protein
MKLAETFAVLPAVGLIGMAACVADPPAEPAALPGPAADLTPGFNEREPDTCKAAGLQHLLGQPSATLQTLPMPGPVRIIAPGDVVDQEEYRSTRIDVKVDSTGIITQISCG